MKLTKKNKIVLISLAVVLVALFIVYFTAVAPLLEKESAILPIPLDGEGIKGTRLTIYKPLDKENLVSITVSNEYGEYTFNNVKDKDGNYIGKIKGYENLQYEDIYYAYLLSYAVDPIIVDNAPYRNLTDEQMAEYGVTEDTCSATMTVTYKDNGVEKTHVLRVGYETFTSNSTFYVAYEGRNTVYRFSSGAYCTYLNIADYITPAIYNGYESVSEAALNIIQFQISKGNVSSGNVIPFLRITGKQFVSVQDGKEYMTVTHTYHVIGSAPDYKSVKTAEADRSYVNAAMSVFYTQFYGDRVIAVDPDDATLDKYGLGSDDTVYIVNASNAKNDLPTFFISQPIYDDEVKATFYYTSIIRDDVQLLIRIPESIFVPKNQYKDVESKVFDETKLINWASTNTTASGFNQAIADDGNRFTGVKEITVKVPTSVYQYGQETFYIDFVTNSSGESILHVTTASGRYEDKGPTQPKPFNSFFRVLISYPDAARFNNFTEAQVDEYAKEENLMYSIEAVMNDGTIERYEYYRISSEYVMVCVTNGEITGGVREMGARKCIYDSTRAQIEDAVHVAFRQLMNGDKITVK